MDFLISLVKIIHIIVSLLLIVVVMFQSGKGGGMGAIGGATTTVLGGGGNTFLVRFAAYLCGIFILTSMGLAYFATRGYEQRLARQAAVVKAGQVQKLLTQQEKEAKDAQALSGKIEKHLKEAKIPNDKTKDKVTQLHNKAKADTTVANALLKNILSQIVSTRVETQGAQKSGDTAAAAKVQKQVDDIKKQIEKESKRLKDIAKDLGIKLEDPKDKKAKDDTKKPQIRVVQPSTKPASAPAVRTASPITQPAPTRTVVPAPVRPTVPAPTPAPVRPTVPAPAPAPVRPTIPAPTPAPVRAIVPTPSTRPVAPR